MVNEKNLPIIASDSGLIAVETTLPIQQVKELFEIFDPYVAQIAQLVEEANSIVVTDESDTETMKLAREKRLELRRLRNEAENHRKEQKQFSLETGRLIDRVAKLATLPSEEAEAHLEAQEKYAEIKEAERKEALRAERQAAIDPFIEPGTQFPALEEMSEEAFERFRRSLEDGYNARTERERREAEEAAQRAEEARKERECLEAIAREREVNCPGFAGDSKN